MAPRFYSLSMLLGQSQRYSVKQYLLGAHESHWARFVVIERLRRALADENNS